MTSRPGLYATALLALVACVSLSYAQDKDRRKVRAGEFNAKPAKGERHPDKLKVGDAAPDFTLADPTGKTQTTLSSFQGRRPVVLIFASCT